MKAFLTSLRQILQVGWIIPLFWLISPHLLGAPASTLPGVVVVLFGTLTMLLWSAALEYLGTASQRLWVRPVAGLLLSALALGVVGIAFSTALSPSLAAILLNWALLEAVGLWSMRLPAQDVAHRGVVGDFAFGLLFLVSGIVIASQVRSGLVHATPLADVGVTLYSLVGILTLAVSRRFITEDSARDQRGKQIDPGWVLATFLLVGAIGVLALAALQIFAFDLVGAFDHLTHPVQDLVGSVLGFGGQSILRLLYWVGGLIGFRPDQHYTPPPVHHFHHHHPPHHHRVKRVRSTEHTPGWFLALIKVIGVVVAGGLVLLLLAFGMRRFGGFHRSPLQGERRTSSWSWGKMFSWLLRRARADATSLVPAWRLPRRQGPIRSVRDVYRRFLRLGSSRARPRDASETGLEYSRDIGNRWASASDPLGSLNNLYMAERYGEYPVTSETVATATDDLARLETAAASHESQP